MMYNIITGWKIIL